jgi:hypothetical protein
MDLLHQEQNWEKDQNEEYVLISMDVKSMYMNISEKLGIKAIQYFVTEKPELLHSRFSLDFLIDAILLVLKHNVSFFDGTYRRQVHGCAMGSHKSPDYSSLAVAYLEKTLYQRSEYLHGLEYANYLREMLRRFLDDSFIKWRMSLGDPKDLLLLMNDLDSKIQFTMETGTSLPFLDIRFTLNVDKSLSMDIFYKETNTHNYVPFFSFHPHKTLTNIPYTLARRICTIVSERNVCTKRLEELKGFLKKRQYPIQVINSGIERALSLDRLTLLVPSDKPEEKQGIPFLLTHNCKNPQITSMIMNGLDLLAPSKRMQRVMDTKKVIAARRQPPNIKQMLFCPRFETAIPSSPGSVIPCRNNANKKPTRGALCKCCDLLDECTDFLFAHSSEPFQHRCHFNCETMSVKYAITCDGWGENYIGQTERSVQERNGDHRRAIQDGKFVQGFHQHIFQCGKGIFSMCLSIKSALMTGAIL